MGRVASKGNEVMKQPSDMPTPGFEHKFSSTNTVEKYRKYSKCLEANHKLKQEYIDMGLATKNDAIFSQGFPK